MALLARLRSTIADLKAGKPGRRFRDYHARKHAARRGGGACKGVLFIAGWALIALGAFFSLVPGIPGILLAVPGAALLSAQSRYCARALDWLELRVRRLIA